jgi:C1A family cysteine protease
MAMILLDRLEAMLTRTNARWRCKSNRLLSLTDGGRRQHLGVLVNEQKRIREASCGDLGLARRAAASEKVVDWRNRHGRNHVTSVKDQGGCGSSVMFSVTASLESTVSIEYCQTLDLSEADLDFRSADEVSRGWWPADAIEQLRDRGAVRLRERQTLWTVSDRKQWLANVGPLCGVFEVFQDFYAYASGVYEHQMGSSEGLHCVQVIGYSDVENCWICKNSWGSDWGDDGFFKIAYGQCRIDPGDPPPMTSNAFAMHGMKGAVLEEWGRRPNLKIFW